MISEIIEYTLLAGLFVVQIWIAWSLWKKIKYYKDIFRVMPEIVPPKIFNLQEAIDQGKDENLTESYTSYRCIRVKHKNTTFKTIAKSINDYTTNNNGVGIDYHLIKDIVDRNVGVIVQEIENKIPGPLYIGLAGTMFGIIMGLIKVDFDLDSATNNVALSAIQPLIDGVKSAMIVSISGLIITTLFSIRIFKNASVMVEMAKNAFLSLLQVELLPRVNNSQLPEIEILSHKLDDFSRTAVTVLDTMEYAISATSKSLSRESEILDKIKHLDVNQMAKFNIQTLDKLKAMMGSVNTFSSHFSELSDSLSSTNSIALDLRDFVNNTHKVSEVLEEIKKNVQESNSMYQFFNAHIKSFETYGNAVNEAVTNADSKMSKAVAKLSEVSQVEMNAIGDSVISYNKELTKSFETSVKRFGEAMTEQVKRTEKAFEEGRPRFEQLEQLKHLETINKSLTNSNDQLRDQLESVSQDIAQSNINMDKFMTMIGQTLSDNNLALNEYLRKVDSMTSEILTELKKQKQQKTSKVNGGYNASHEDEELNRTSETIHIENNNSKEERKKLTFKEVLFFWKKLP